MNTIYNTDNKKLKFAFIIQGEGRGHMTQAISMKQILTNAGHEVVAVMVGRSKRRSIPSFFKVKIGLPVVEFDSPNFVTNANNRGVNILKTVFYNTLRLPVYIKSLNTIRNVFNQHNPDIVINFYEVMCGIYFKYNLTTNIKHVCIGHQYLYQHPDIVFPEKSKFNQSTFRYFSNLTSHKAVAKLALSFRDMSNQPDKKLIVVPPLLRKEVLEAKPENNDFLLMYILNDGYSEDVINEHEKNPDIKIRCFWDKKDTLEKFNYSENLAFYKINDVKFLEHLKNSSGLMCSAGFESICEAMYLGKPVYMMPTEGHFEQECNALDAVRSGAGLQGTKFDIKRFWKFVQEHKPDNSAYKTWVEKGPDKFVNALLAIAEEELPTSQLENNPLRTVHTNAFQY